MRYVSHREPVRGMFLLPLPVAPIGSALHGEVCTDHHSHEASVQLLFMAGRNPCAFGSTRVRINPSALDQMSDTTKILILPSLCHGFRLLSRRGGQSRADSLLRQRGDVRDYRASKLWRTFADRIPFIPGCSRWRDTKPSRRWLPRSVCMPSLPERERSRRGRSSGLRR
jgi:hypothetical protein